MAEAPILSWEGLGLHQGSGWLFQDIDIHIAPRDRLALIGRNGAGKTTLLKLIADEVEADRGNRSIQPGTRVVMLEQEPDFSKCKTLMDYALSGKDAPERFAVEAIADQIGIDMEREAHSASGGERRRAALARALAMEPNLLLLDEPTNHLDLAAIDWLESWLNRYKGAFVTISHDRTFLKRLTRATFWLDRGSLRRKEVGFGGYEAWEEQVYAEEARAADKLDAKLKLEAHWLERGVTARRKRNQGRLEKLYDMRAQRAAMISPGGVAKMKLESDDVKTKSVIVAEKVSKSYGDRVILRDFSLRIQRGDRIGLVGSNGAGKTTLLNLLTGEIQPDTGKITLAKTLNGVMIDQQRSLLLPEKRVRDILAEGGDWIDVRGQRKHIQSYMKDFLFDPSLVDARVGTLSGGERSRLLLAREFSRTSNLLVLDEPTNDLDLETLDLLQEVIADYDGTVLIVSHDRDFLDRTVNVTLGLDGSGEVDIVAGGYADWEAKRKQRSTSASKSKSGSKGRETPPPQPPQKSKLTYKDQRDYELLPQKIEEMEAQIARGEEALSDPDLYSRDPKKFAHLTDAITKVREEKDAAEERWLALAEQVETADS
ncbi:ABC-F family ATP-binding cassette domain-containing protein [Altericroceibacterium endophyticum]|uniref:ATP-binding cassette domain-containing protein n=1 Tax=Altericroceibacterium endophyticum TaxID=1808508 RepID=A0A6I4T2F9_9SPHN|nr:ATP-binding cassette domain-containing protein [Altericroceibacterium endophyticum]MXO64319.1 ATP-binding cassette domain-containing protein [Altericroceibacterium endophyticum]